MFLQPLHISDCFAKILVDFSEKLYSNTHIYVYCILQIIIYVFYYVNIIHYGMYIFNAIFPYMHICCLVCAINSQTFTLHIYESAHTRQRKSSPNHEAFRQATLLKFSDLA